LILFGKIVVILSCEWQLGICMSLLPAVGMKLVEAKIGQKYLTALAPSIIARQQPINKVILSGARNHSPAQC